MLAWEQLLPDERPSRRSFCCLRCWEGWGSNGETPSEEGPQTAVCQGTEALLSYFMRKKTNKQTKRSKERGKKGNHGDHPKEPKTANTASRAGDAQLCSSGRLEAYLDQKKTKPSAE